MKGRVIQLPRRHDGCGPDDGKDREYPRTSIACFVFRSVPAKQRIAEQNESSGKARKGERSPGEQREKPRLGRAKIVASIYIRLYRPRQPSWAPSCVERRGSVL